MAADHSTQLDRIETKIDDLVNLIRGNLPLMQQAASDVRIKARMDIVRARSNMIRARNAEAAPIKRRVKKPVNE
jgi:hypothetical protein